MVKNNMLIALLEEYEKVAKEFYSVIKGLSNQEFVKIRDAKTNDNDCKSIQTVANHVVQSGYTYANYFNSVSKRAWFEYEKKIDDPKIVINEFEKMLMYTENSFEGIWQKTNKEIEAIKIETRWNVTYDFEQLLEHAIVHVLRHRRQVENFLKNN